MTTTILIKKIKEFLANKSKVNFLIIILLAVLYLGLFFRPKVKAVFLHLSEASKLKRQVINTRKQWAEIDTLKDKVLRLNEKLDYYEKRLPSEKETPAILEYLSGAAEQLDVRITEIEPLEQDKDTITGVPLYYRVPILLKAECGYHQLGRFLNKLEGAGRFMKISDIKITPNPRRANIHNVQLIIVTYGMRK